MKERIIAVIKHFKQLQYQPEKDEPSTGFEAMTFALQVRCSTNHFNNDNNNNYHNNDDIIINNKFILCFYRNINPLSPSIKLQILLLCFHTFLTEVVGRSC